MNMLRQLFSFLRLRKPLKHVLGNISRRTAQTFYVYDGASSIFGARFSFAKDKPRDGVSVYKVSGAHHRPPRDGDRVVIPMRRGTTGLFILYNVNTAPGPDERFTAQAVCVANDYKGGVGPKGAVAASSAEGPRIIQALKE